MKKTFPAVLCLCAAFRLSALGGMEEAPVYPVPDGMELVWSDEFGTDGAPDPARWDYSLGGNGWGNGELQNYTDSRDNSWIKDGRLFIAARKNDGKWTSARLKTQFLGDWKYGYFEIRAKLPAGRGTWPAIWMMPMLDTYGGWPRSGEIDIMEHVGFDENVIHHSLHSRDLNHRNGNQITASVRIDRAVNAFHTYALEWDPQFIRWLVDGRETFRAENPGTGNGAWPFDIPFYLILNVAIGGEWGGQQGIDSGLKRAVMEVDYVRVYQRPEAAENTAGE